MKRITVFILFSLLLIACSKETKTPGQVTADEISSVSKQHSITNVIIYISSGTGYSTIGPISFTLSGQYLVTSGLNYFNLENLSFFYVSSAPVGGQTVGVLALYFQ